MTARSALLVVPYNPLVSPGGLQSRALRTAAALRGRGWHAAVAAPGVSGSCQGIPVIGFEHSWGLVRTVLTSEWDVLHWFEVFPDRHAAFTQHAVSLLARMAGRRCVVLGSGTPGNVRRRGLRWLLRRVAVWAYDGAIVFNQEFDGEYLDCGFQPGAILYLPQHIDCDRFRPAHPDVRRAARSTLGLPQDVFLVVYVGRLVRRKRVDLVIEACRRLTAEGPAACALLVVGASWQHEDSADAQIHVLLDRLRAVCEVRQIGQVEDPRPYYWAADVVVVPSDVDGEAAVVAEAAACERIVIVSDASSLRALVPDDRGGLVFARGSADALAGALRHARGLGGRYQELAARHRALIVSHHDVGDLGARIEALYNKLQLGRDLEGARSGGR